MWLFRWLLWILPRDFRDEHGAELLKTARERWRDRQGAPGRQSYWRFWLRQCVGLFRAARGLRWGGSVLGAADQRRGALSDARPREAAMTSLWKDIRHATRGLWARPGFSLAAILTLGLGVGVTTTMYSAVRTVLLRELPYRDAEQVVVLRQTDRRDGSPEDGVSLANLLDVAIASRALEHPAAAAAHGYTLMQEGRALSLRGWLVSEEFFPAIGAPMHLGRGLGPADFAPEAPKVVVLSHATWQHRFAGDPALLGHELLLDGAAHTVVGVLEERFKYPSAAELWAPRLPQPWDEEMRGSAGMESLAPGAWRDTGAGPSRAGSSGGGPRACPSAGQCQSGLSCHAPARAPARRGALPDAAALGCCRPGAVDGRGQCCRPVAGQGGGAQQRVRPAWCARSQLRAHAAPGGRGERFARGGGCSLGAGTGRPRRCLARPLGPMPAAAFRGIERRSWSSDLRRGCSCAQRRIGWLGTRATGGAH